MIDAIYIKTLIELTKSIEDSDRQFLCETLPSLKWEILFPLAFRYKVIGVAFDGINKLFLQKLIPHNYYRLMKFFHQGNRERNNIYHNEMENVANFLQANEIKFLPLKGAILTHAPYYPEGTRGLNDIDLLVRKKDIDKIDKIMRKNAFIPGTFDFESRSVVQVSDKEFIAWRLNLINLHPYLKKTENNFIDFVAFDFAHGIKFEKSNVDAVSMLFSHAIDVPTCPGRIQLSHIDFYIHLCCHLYKEATRSEWKNLKHDQNLIKYNDVRMFSAVNVLISDEVIERAKELDVIEALTYVVVRVGYLYESIFEVECVKAIGSPVFDKKEFMAILAADF